MSINFNKVSGGHQASSENQKAVQRLLAQSDFLGLSCYGPVSVPPRAEDFSQIVDSFAAEMKAQGVEVPKELPLHLSEVGLGGGGNSGRADDIAQSPTEAAGSAWAGTSDPQKNPWNTDEMRAFRRDYYRALLEFLRTQPSDWHVTSAYMWNMGSWCPYGLSGGPVFTDEEITETIRVHNEQIAKRP